MGYCWTCAAIVALDGSSLIISNNLILRATGDGYGAILASESEYVSYNNTLVSNRGGYTNLFSDGTVINDIIITYPNGWGNSVMIDDNSSIQISYSNIEGGWEGTGNIDSDPMFTDLYGGDYTLSNYSPAIGAGTVTGAPTGDIAGNIRPNPANSTPDMGAYESSRSERLSGAKYYVATTGSDSSSLGTSSTPFLTIQRAVDAAWDGDTVLVYAKSVH